MIIIIIIIVAIQYRNCQTLYVYVGTRWRSWLRHCATYLKVAGSVGIFHLHNGPGVD